jgi:hypothetical protein
LCEKKRKKKKKKKKEKKKEKEESGSEEGWYQYQLSLPSVSNYHVLRAVNVISGDHKLEEKIQESGTYVYKKTTFDRKLNLLFFFFNGKFPFSAV